MPEPKPLASLSAGLLARKGAARPAMRRQAQALGNASFGNQEDLGWNDMGYDVDPHHGAQDMPRSVDHGLSPMTAPQASPAAPVADPFDALGQAVDRAMAELPAARPATVQPLDAETVVPESAEPPAVLEQQQRIEQALSAAEPVIVADPVPADAMDAIRSAMTAIPAAAPVRAAAMEQAAVSSSRNPRARSRAGARGNFAFTLRLDPDRHLRLRLASATSNRSAQQIIIQLIDDYLADLPEIDAFAAQVPASRTDR